MAAIAVSPHDEKRIIRLVKHLAMRSKAAVVRLAIDELERRVARDQLGAGIREYVQKYGRLDRKENALLRRSAP